MSAAWVISDRPLALSVNFLNKLFEQAQLNKELYFKTGAEMLKS